MGNQGMTVAVIIFVILTVVSMGGAVFFAKESTKLSAAAEAAEKEKAAAEKDRAESYAQMQEVAGILGNVKKDIPATMRTRLQADLARFGDRINAVETNSVVELTEKTDSTTGEKSYTVTYTAMLDAAITLLEKRSVQLTEQKVRADRVENELRLAREQFAKDKLELYGDPVDPANPNDPNRKLGLLGTAEKSRDEAVKAADDLRKQLQDKQTQFDATERDLAARIDAVTREKDAEIATLKTESAKLSDQLKAKAEEVKKFIEIKFAATFDGEIVQVNASNRTVWINAGTLDNLPKHVTFSVYQPGVALGGDNPPTPKGKIEVVRVIGDHLAEARIIEDNLRDPILTGDRLFTPAWDPGQITHFAFAGKFDLDGDGNDDMEQVRAIVARNGGVIDAEVVNGQIQKTPGLTINTRYLVLGAAPADKADNDAYLAMSAEATQLGIQTMSLPMFLDQIGFKPQMRTQQFGTGASGLSAREAPDGGPRVSTSPVSPLFRTRRPPATTGSAY